jgi:hypothetical protein
MAAAHLIPELNREGLRHFGLVTGGIAAGLFGLIFPWLLHRPWPLWPWILLALLASVGFVAPVALKPVYKAWMRLGLLLNRVTTPLILGIVFFLVISPIALVRRLKKSDELRRHFDEHATSYRVPSVARPKQTLERPF